MKYKTKDVIAGLEEMDLQDKGRLQAGVAKTKEEIQSVLNKGRIDTVLIGQIASGLADRIDKGAIISCNDMAELFQKPAKYAYQNNKFLGQDDRTLELLNKELAKSEKKLAEWQESEFLRFLRGLTDEFVTDYGVAKAGYGGYSLGRIVMAGRA